MTEPRLKVGQIGTAHFGAHRRKTLRETGLFDVVAVYDWDAERTAAAAREENAHACGSYAQLLEFPGLEAVIVSTGAKYHAEHVSLALRHGLPVFVEKPLCSTADEVAQLLQLQRETGLPVGLGHTDHSNSAASRTMKRLIREGSVGEVVAFEKTTAHNGGFHIKPGDWRGDPEKNPGGMLFQCGVHALHELMYFFGPLQSVRAHMRYDVHTTGTADAAHCILNFENGVSGTLNAYHVTPYRHTFSIFGTRSNLYRDDFGQPGGPVLLQQTTQLDHKHEPQLPVPLVSTGVTHGELRAFYRAVRSGQMQYPSLLDGARAVSAVFAAEKAALSGGTEPIAAL